MKNQTKIFLILVGFLTQFDLSAISFSTLQSITKELLQVNGLNYAVNLSIDNIRAQGYAAIRYDYVTNEVSIFVDSRQLRNKSANTWAFIIGHELGHKYLGPHTGAKGEWAADEVGGKLGLNAGYSLAKYIEDMLNDHNNCSHSHGCWHSRAHNLAKIYNISINGSSENDHKNHRDAEGPFPHQEMPKPNPKPSIVVRRVPCTHRVSCQHVYSNGCKLVRKHHYDVKHEYDLEYVEMK